MPIVTITLIVFEMVNYSLSNLISSLGLILSVSVFSAMYYEKEYTSKLIVSNIYGDNFDYNLLKNRELIIIDGKEFYVSKCNAIIVGEKIIELSFKSSKFEGRNIHLFCTYLEEYIEMLLEYKKSKMCPKKDKNEVGKAISTLIEIKKDFEMCI